MAAPAPRREQQRSINTKAAILAAGLNEFARLGFDGASTRSITEQAGVNHNLIRHHFGTKEGLWKAIARQVFEGYNDRIQSRLNGLDGVDQKTVTRLLLKEFILFSAEVPDFNRFMMQANQGETNRLVWMVDEFLRQGSQQEIVLLELAQNVGVFTSGSSDLLRYMFIGAATSIFTFAAEFKEMTGKNAFDGEVIDEHVNLMLTLFTGASE